MHVRGVKNPPAREWHRDAYDAARADGADDQAVIRCVVLNRLGDIVVPRERACQLPRRRWQREGLDVLEGLCVHIDCLDLVSSGVHGVHGNVDGIIDDPTRTPHCGLLRPQLDHHVGRASDATARSKCLQRPVANFWVQHRSWERRGLRTEAKFDRR